MIFNIAFKDLTDGSLDLMDLSTKLSRGSVKAFYLLLDTFPKPFFERLRGMSASSQRSLVGLGYYDLWNLDAFKKKTHYDGMHVHTDFHWDLKERVCGFCEDCLASKDPTPPPISVPSEENRTPRAVPIQDRKFRVPKPLPGLPSRRAGPAGGPGVVLIGFHTIVDCYKSLEYGLALFYQLSFILAIYEKIKEGDLKLDREWIREITLCVATLSGLGYAPKNQDALYYKHVLGTIYVFLRRSRHKRWSLSETRL